MFTAHPHAEGHTRQAQAGAGSRGVELRSSLDPEGIDAALAAAAENVCATESDSRETAGVG
jgi:hypothetical protein